MKMGEVKALLDTTSLSNLRSLEERLHLFAGNVDSNVGLLRRAIQTNRGEFDELASFIVLIIAYLARRVWRC